VPIEIKPIGDYSFEQLEKIISGQLLGRYMLPPDREEGVLLLVRLKNKTWRIDGRPTDFDSLVVKLRSRAEVIGRNAGRVIHVERIDLVELPTVSTPRQGSLNRLSEPKLAPRGSKGQGRERKPKRSPGEARPARRSRK
jgi:hypothetical protein